MARVYEPQCHRDTCQNAVVGADTAAELLALATALERRDEIVALELDALRELAERVDTTRTRAAAVRDGLGRLPDELDELRRRRAQGKADADAARSRLAAAEARLGELEGARRRREDAVDRARSEVATARDALDDAVAQLERLAEREHSLLEDRESLEAEGKRLVRDAAEVAGELRAVERIAEVAGREPGETLEELEEWGGQARSALFVARGALETERERIVVEANALGSAVLGEQLGASSVAIVRRRIEDRLG
jgi:chromosome segregation ATPase